jgi:RNA-binding protein 26
MHTFRNAPRDDKTLVVEKIPDEKLTLEAVNEWFKRFGTVTNVAIDSSSSKALVSFSNHTEAHTAWKSEEAVFGNRFVRLFWHRPLDGQGGVGQRALAASAPLIKHISNFEASGSLKSDQPSSLQPQPGGVSATPGKQPSRPDAATAAALAARQQLLERQISEQKVLMSRLSTATTPQEREEIMTRIRSIQNGSVPLTPIAPQASSSKPANGKDGSKVLSEKERLDKELELHVVQTALGGNQASMDSEATSTAALTEKLAQLKAEVFS